MKAMILAAGLGTRLRPWTNTKPKALVQYQDKPLLQWVIEKLKVFDIKEVIINVYYMADMIIDFVKKNNYFGIHIEFSIEEELLDTGGGIKKAQWFLENSPMFVVYNVDILSDINLKNMLKAFPKNAIASLAVQQRETNRYLIFDKKSKNLCGWKNTITKSQKIINKCKNYYEFAFSGIHVISNKIFDFLPEGKYSIINAYLDIAKKNIITFYDHSRDKWRDMGQIESFQSSIL